VPGPCDVRPVRRLGDVYDVEGPDRAIAIADVPASSPGAPLPLVMANEHTLLLAYLAAHPDPNWDGTYVRVVDQMSVEPVAVVEFQRPTAHFFGPPNDETLHGHPLWGRGLKQYGVFRVEQSSWIRELTRVDSVHRQHDPAVYATQTHFVFAFHDSTFECIAKSLTAKVHPGPLAAAAQEMHDRLLGSV
jgi:hypothetical protein